MRSVSCGNCSFSRTSEAMVLRSVARPDGTREMSQAETKKAARRKLVRLPRTTTGAAETRAFQARHGDAVQCVEGGPGARRRPRATRPLGISLALRIVGVTTVKIKPPLTVSTVNALEFRGIGDDGDLRRGQADDRLATNLWEVSRNDCGNLAESLGKSHAKAQSEKRKVSRRKRGAFLVRSPRVRRRIAAVGSFRHSLLHG